MSEDRLDLDAYRKRIEYAGPLEPTAAVIEALHLAHATHIPFENVDVLQGRPIRLDLASLQAKLVAGGRGGYCFEQNLLFAAVLRAAGFDVTMLAARVRHRGDKVLPRTHMALLARAGASAWIADVGFGGEGLVLPVPFGVPGEFRHHAWAYRIVEEAAGQWLLQSRHGASWGNLYSFTLEPQALADYEMANHYTSTHPDSPFPRMLIVQLPTPEARYMLKDGELVVDRGGNVERRVLRDDADVRSVLAETFGLRFPAGTRFGVRGTID